MKNLVAMAVAAGLTFGALVARAADNQELGQDSMTQNGQYVGHVRKIDAKKGTITVELPIAKNAQIVRDGNEVSLDSIQQGDDIRAEFKPTTDGVTKLDIESKQKAKKDSKSGK